MNKPGPISFLRFSHQHGRVALTISLFSLFIQAQAQSQKLSVDSLEQQVNVREGLEKAFVLHELVYAYLRIDKEKAERYHQH